jgi:hypothetical protein
VGFREQILSYHGQVDPATGKIYSYAKIAELVGCSKSMVDKEIHRTARDPLPGSGDSAGGSLPAPGPLPADPVLAEARRRLEQDRLELMSLDVRARRLEQEKRLELLSKGGSGDGAATMMLLDQLRDLRGQIATIASQARQPAASAPSLTDQLGQWRQIGEVMQSFAPSRAPSSAVELEFKAMIERINAEDRRLQRQFDAEREERMERVRGEARRNEAMATAIEQTLPLIGQGINQWLSTQGAGNGGGPTESSGIRPLIAPASPPPTAGPADPGDDELQPGEVAGECPECGAGIAVPIDAPGACPNCRAALAVAGERIILAQPREGGIRRMQPVAS